MKSIPHGTSILLCLVILLSILPGVLLLIAGATAADDQEEKLLGTLSAQYEASSPATISNNSGDPGGKSYGSYQFASNFDIPKSFFEWCQSSADAYYRSIGTQLQEAYDNDGGYGTNFDSTWKKLASEDGDGFARVQRNYVRYSYYDPIISSMEGAVPGFKISNYSIALRNVFWSRAVQHGTGGAKTVITRAFDSLGGFANQAENKLINAIYNESGALISDGKTKMTGTTADKYGISGMTLKYYTGCSADIQLGVYTRLRINEPAQAQSMLAAYGYADAPLCDGVYRLQPATNSKLATVAGTTSATLNTVADKDTQRFQLTYHASGYYTIDNISSGKRLAANSSGVVTLAAAGTSNTQLWKLKTLNSGFSLKNRSTGQYLTVSESAAGGQLKTDETDMQWQLALAGAGWSLDGGAYPSYSSTLQAGSSSFPFRGTLRCSYNIDTVKVAVLNASGSDAFTPATDTPNDTSYDLSQLDSAVAFSRLTAGSYTLVITATSSAPSDGTYTVKSPFYVSDGGYTLTFNPGSGTCSTAGRKISAGQVYGTLPTAKKSGYIFKGWYTAASGGTKVTANSIAPASNVTLYARYTKAYTYTFLNYDGSVFATGELASGSKIPMPDTTPVRNASSTRYYTFSSWQGYTSGMTISADISFKPEFTAHDISALDHIDSGVYKISGNWLRAIPTDTTVAQLKNNLHPGSNITISKDGAAATGLAGTGMIVKYTRDGKVVEKLTVVVTGDINGDGQCTLTDMVKLRAHLLGKSHISGAALQAADLNGDGQCTLTDMVQCLSVQLGRTTIKPN